MEPLFSISWAYAPRAKIVMSILELKSCFIENMNKN